MKNPRCTPVPISKPRISWVFVPCNYCLDNQTVFLSIQNFILLIKNQCVCDCHLHAVSSRSVQKKMNEIL